MMSPKFAAQTHRIHVLFCVCTDPWMVELCSKLGKYTVRPHGILRKTNVQRIQASWDRISRVRTFLSDSIDPAMQASIG